MGMYDYVICRASLPGSPPPYVDAGHRFQTKDFDRVMETYEITADGRLRSRGDGFSRADGPRDVAHHGDVEFYTSNVRASGPGLYTEDGEDADSVTYRARFDRGRLAWIVEVEREVRPALPLGRMRPLPRPSGAEVAEAEARASESLVGRTMHVLWGGTEAGYPVEIVAEGPRQWVARQADGTPELLDRGMRGRILFDSEADARAARAAKLARWEAGRREYEALVEAQRAGGAEGRSDG